MVSGSITKDGMSKSNVNQCGVCSLRVKANTIFCVQCCRWIHGVCAVVKSVTQKFSRNITCRKYDGNVGDAVEQEEKLCDEVETVWEFTYPGDRVSAGGGYETAVTDRTRCGLVNVRACDEFPYGRRFPLKL